MIRKEPFRVEIRDQDDRQERVALGFELIYILEGTLNITVEQKTYYLRTQDIFMVNAGRKHSLQNGGGGLLYMEMTIREQDACEVLGSGDVSFWCDSSSSDSARYQELRTLLQRLLNSHVSGKKETNYYGYLADGYAVLEKLTANFLLKAADLQGSTEDERYGERLHQINDYIFANYDQPISMKELSEKLYLSNGYLSRFFKKNYGMSFANYLNTVRASRAADDLTYTDLPITRIAYNNGFTSAALFNKVFHKVYGQTPTEFRKMMEACEKTEENDRHQSELTERVEKVLQEEEGKAEKPQKNPNLVSGVFDALQKQSYTQNWNKVINLGDASHILNSRVQEHLYLLKNALGFRYVRFDSIFSRELYIRLGTERVNFDRVDAILDCILSMGMIPQIDLGVRVAKVFMGEGESMLMDGSQTDPGEEGAMGLFPVEQWEQLMEAFMSHLSNRYGEDSLDEWRMELWFDEKLRHEDVQGDRYLNLFETTYRVIHEYNPNIQLGGYGIRMDYGLERRKQFYAKWSKRQIRPDFLSVMYYAYERGENGLDVYAKRTTDDENLIHLFRREKAAIAEAGMGDIPVYLEEWNLTPSVRNYMNDATYKGAYVIKNTLDLFGETDEMAYGAGTDLQKSSFDTSGLLFGGTGLLTKDGIMKPAAFAYEFLNRLYPYVIGKNDHMLVTTNGHHNFGMVCHNMQELNYNYYLTPEKSINRTNLWKYYQNRHKLEIRAVFTNVPDGKYRVKTYRINDESGSVMNIWQEMNFEEDLSHHDLEYFRRICEPNLSIRIASAEGGKLEIEDTMQPNEILFIRIRKCS